VMRTLRAVAGASRLTFRTGVARRETTMTFVAIRYHLHRRA
jgi:hypothetical protein